MQRNWTHRYVDLALLTTRISDFFKERDFESIEGEIQTGYQILAENSSSFKIQGYVRVTIEGKPEDFTVNLDRGGNADKHSWSSPLLRMLGGGYLLLQQIRSEEEWTRLEKEFWRHVENAVLHLTNSAKSSSSIH